VLDDASSIPSLIVDLNHLLDEVTTSGSRLIAFPPLLLTFDDQSPAIGWCHGFLIKTEYEKGQKM
jgi:hypothetical protein